MNNENKKTIEAFEKLLIKLELEQLIPGTTIIRCVLENGKLGWNIGIGGLMLPKSWHYGESLLECLEKANVTN
jgi:hypothetical protein